MTGTDPGGAPRRVSWAGRLWAALALLACPCHLLLWLPLLSGSVLGALLLDHLHLSLAILLAVFVLSLVLALRAFGRSA